eukprot:12035381-Alexandrium_andersonii.AAC.1
MPAAEEGRLTAPTGGGWFGSMPRPAWRPRLSMARLKRFRHGRFKPALCIAGCPMCTPQSSTDA